MNRCKALTNYFTIIGIRQFESDIAGFYPNVRPPYSLGKTPNIFLKHWLK